jgi:hypothetical protein
LAKCKSLWFKYGDFNPFFSPKNKATLGQAFPKKKKKTCPILLPPSGKIWSPKEKPLEDP